MRDPGGTVSAVPFVPDVAPVIASVVISLDVPPLPGAPAAAVVADARAPLAVPTPDAVRGRVEVRIDRVDHDARDCNVDSDRPRHRDDGYAGGQQQRSSANHRPSRLHRTSSCRQQKQETNSEEGYTYRVVQERPALRLLRKVGPSCLAMCAPPRALDGGSESKLSRRVRRRLECDSERHSPLGRRIPSLRCVIAGMQVALDAQLALAFGEGEYSDHGKQRPLRYRVVPGERRDVCKSNSPAALDMARASEAVVGVSMRVAAEP